MSEQTVLILIRLLSRSSLIRIYTVCHSFYIFWRHYFLVKLNCFILRTTTVAGLGVPIFRVFTVHKLHTQQCKKAAKNDLSLKDHNSVKIHSSSLQHPYAHLQYVHNMSSKFEKHSMKTVRGVDYTNSISYSAKKLPKMTKFKRL